MAQTDSTRDRLLAAARAVIASIDAADVPRRVVIVTARGNEHIFRVRRGESLAPPPVAAPAAGQQPQPDRPPRSFSPTEEAILAALRGRGWLTAPDVAAAAGLACSSTFKAILANLAERGEVESGRAGYHLAG